MCTAPFLSCGKIMWSVGAPSGAPSAARAQPRAGLRTPPAGPRLVSDHPMIVGSNRGLAATFTEPKSGSAVECARRSRDLFMEACRARTVPYAPGGRTRLGDRCNCAVGHPRFRGAESALL